MEYSVSLFIYISFGGRAFGCIGYILGDGEGGGDGGCGMRGGRLRGGGAGS